MCTSQVLSMSETIIVRRPKPIAVVMAEHWLDKACACDASRDCIGQFRSSLKDGRVTRTEGQVGIKALDTLLGGQSH